MKKKSMDWYKQQQRFSVRKYHFGAASVLLGTALVFGGAQVSADEVTAPATPSTESTTATSAETTTASEGAPAVLTASEASSSTEATSLDKGALQVALSQAKALDLSNKTSETVAILLAQIEHAQTVLNTATSQEELNQAVTDLQAAQAQLADKPAQPVAVSPASVATTSAPATSTTSSTPEATTPASVTASSTSSTSEATTSASTATAETSSSSPVVATPTRSRRTRRDTSASTHTPVSVDNTSSASISIGTAGPGYASIGWSISTVVDKPVKEGDYVEYTFENISMVGVNGRNITFGGKEIAKIEAKVTNSEWGNVRSSDPSVYNNAVLDGEKGYIRVTFNKEAENFSNINYKIENSPVGMGTSVSANSWQLVSKISNKNGQLTSNTVTIPGDNIRMDPYTSTDIHTLPGRVGIQNDGTLRGGANFDIAHDASHPIEVGDRIVFQIHPSDSVRFDLSKDINKSLSNNRSSIPSGVNPNGVYLFGNKSVLEIESYTDTAIVLKVKEFNPSIDSIFIYEIPIIVTDVSKVDATNKVIKGNIFTATINKANGTTLSTDSKVQDVTIGGTITGSTAVVAPRSSVYVQYVDESGTPIPGTTKTTLLNNEVTGTPYTASGLDLVAFPNYTFVKMQDGSAPATGNSTTIQKLNALIQMDKTSLLNTMIHQVQKTELLTKQIFQLVQPMLGKVLHLTQVHLEQNLQRSP